MKTNHTPGPWEAHSVAVDGREDHVVTGSGHVICRVTNGTRANAKLIAAAPEMLEALQNLLEYALCMGVPDMLYIDDAKSAIEKATN